MMAGSTSMVGSARENPPLRSGDHCIGVRTPFAVAQMDVVAHGDFVAVIDDWRAGHRQQKCCSSKFDPAPVALE